MRRTVSILLGLMSVLMSIVIIEQGRTLASQRQLIQQLFRDSLELNAVRLKLKQRNR